MVSAAAYTVYSTPGLLTWGVGLKVGDTVLARLPDKSGRGHSAGAQQDQYATAIIRWIGRPTRLSKCQFGVEIVVSTILHCHTCTSTDGADVLVERHARTITRAYSS